MFTWRRQERLAAAYPLFHRNERLQEVVDATIKASTEDDIAVPDNLAERVKACLSDTSMSWDEIIARIAATAALAADEDDESAFDGTFRWDDDAVPVYRESGKPVELAPA
jgi:hypothetical protein